MDQLPTELVHRITEYIADEELSSLVALRGVCRVLERKTSKAFQNRCFETRRLDSSVSSIDRLTKLMMHCHFAPYVKSLIVDTRYEIREDDLETMGKLIECLRQFAGKSLHSVTLFNSEDSEQYTSEDFVDMNDYLEESYYSYGHFLERLCVLTKFAAKFLPALDGLGIKLERLSVPKEKNFHAAYAIGPWGLTGGNVLRQQGSSMFSSLCHLDLHVFPSSVAARADISWSAHDDAVTLVACINTAHQLKSLKLSAQTEGLDNDEHNIAFPNSVFQNMSVPSVETAVFTGWQYLNWKILRSFFERHKKIRYLELEEIMVDAGMQDVHIGLTETLVCLTHSQSLQEFCWKHLDTTSTADVVLMNELYMDPSTSSHRRACDKESCDGRNSFVNCHSSGSVKSGHPGVEDVLHRMIANFRRLKVSSRNIPSL